MASVPSTLQHWVLQSEVDAGARPGITTAEHKRLKALEHGVGELRRSDEILQLVSAFSTLPDRPPDQERGQLVDEHRQAFGAS